MGVNRVTLLGFVGKDPDVQTVKEDKKVARFTLATSESYRNKSGEKVTNTEWHNIVVWRGLADVVEKYVKKGSHLYVEGKLTTRSYEKDGQTKYFTEVVVGNLEMLGGKQESNAQPPQKKETSQVDNEPDFQETSDLPF